MDYSGGWAEGVQVVKVGMVPPSRWWGLAVSKVKILFTHADPSLRSYNTPWILRPCQKPLLTMMLLYYLRN